MNLYGDGVGDWYGDRLVFGWYWRGSVVQGWYGGTAVGFQWGKVVEWYEGMVVDWDVGGVVHWNGCVMG